MKSPLINMNLLLVVVQDCDMIEWLLEEDVFVSTYRFARIVNLRQWKSSRLHNKHKLIPQINTNADFLYQLHCHRQIDV